MILADYKSVILGPLGGVKYSVPIGVNFQCLLTIGEPKAISMAVRNVKQNDRLTYLSERLSS